MKFRAIGSGVRGGRKLLLLGVLAACQGPAGDAPESPALAEDAAAVDAPRPRPPAADAGGTMAPPAGGADRPAAPSDVLLPADAGDGGAAASADAIAAREEEARSSRLPVILLEVRTPIDKDRKVPGRMRIVEEHDGSHRDLSTRPVTLDARIGIELRGASSLSYPQKSYSIELRDEQGNDRDAPVLGMPADADWGLVACWVDKPCLRNALAYAVGRQLGRWTPRARFAEVILDGRYEGLYLLVELPRRGRHRIPIPRPAADANAGDLTGGYVIRRELGGRTPPPASPNVDWISPVTWPDGVNRNVFSHHFPRVEELTSAQRDYIRRWFTRFEEAMKDPGWADPQRGYRAFIDTPSWVDYALVSELSNNIDGYSKSVYFVKQPDAAGGRLAIFPLWDFNLAFGNASFRDGGRTDVWTHTMNERWWGSCSGWFPVPAGCTMCQSRTRTCSNMPYVPFWWGRLWKDPRFLAEAGCRWKELRRGPLDVAALRGQIETWQRHLAPLAVPRHFARWPMLLQKLSENAYVGPSGSSGNAAAFFREEVSYLVRWVESRIAWLDRMLPGSCPSP